MKRSEEQLLKDALQIWHAGLNSVKSEALVHENIKIENQSLVIAEHIESIPLDSINRIIVVGAGKAGAGMTLALEDALMEIAEEKKLTGWVNVPADCVQPTRWIHLHDARPAGVNEPTEEGVRGTKETLKLVASMGPNDLCLCLISGGGSALLPAPIEGITLTDKLKVTRLLSSAGATIQEMNTVRKQLSSIKGGGLADVCKQGTLISLLISDVIGDPLDIIASGPTVPDSGSAKEALEILGKFNITEQNLSPEVFTVLKRLEAEQANQQDKNSSASFENVFNYVIGNNAVAVDTAGLEAVALDYRPSMISAKEPEGLADELGMHLAELAIRMKNEPGPDCLVSGGEPVVELADSEIRGKGGRNQQLIASAAKELIKQNEIEGIVILSGGTDGEDGPTNAAGAYLTKKVLQQVIEQGIDLDDYLKRNDAYHLFEKTESLLLTGPTNTNVMDLRVIVVDRIEGPQEV